MRVLRAREVPALSSVTVRARLMHKTIWLKIHNVKLAGCGSVRYHAEVMHDGWKRRSARRRLSTARGEGGSADDISGSIERAAIA